MEKLTLQDIMSPTPITVKESLPIGEVSHLLLRYRINGIIVTSDFDKNIIKGIFTLTDVLRLVNEVMDKGFGRKKSLKQIADTPVGREIHDEVISLQKDVSVGKAVAVMHKKNIHTIPVYDGKTLIGVVGKHDLINAVLHSYDD
ncbi:MAG: CBS domain-containing protein [Candidatus Omnitrophica bacterium]|nr:CBS domain-containing protein [Candidatus Omnitrophota bacterium]MDD5081503.1 CBS domain-containing protein [Candidatus Omnitrophota bacterium]MDD5441129.1 CBS domain-containing protein [Candidatus Omnitrophota bacterium]